MDSFLGVDLRQASRFLAAGLINTAFGYGVWYVFYQLLDNKDLALIPEYAICTFTGFLLHGRYSFRVRDEPRTRYARFVLAYTTMLVVNWAVLNVVTAVTKAEPEIAQIPATGVAALYSFLLQRGWVFKTLAD